MKHAIGFFLAAVMLVIAGVLLWNNRVAPSNSILIAEGALVVGACAFAAPSNLNEASASIATLLSKVASFLPFLKSPNSGGGGTP